MNQLVIKCSCQIGKRVDKGNILAWRYVWGSKHNLILGLGKFQDALRYLWIIFGSVGIQNDNLMLVTCKTLTRL